MRLNPPLSQHTTSLHYITIFTTLFYMNLEDTKTAVAAVAAAAAAAAVAAAVAAVAAAIAAVAVGRVRSVNFKIFCNDVWGLR